MCLSIAMSFALKVGVHCSLLSARKVFFFRAFEFNERWCSPMSYFLDFFAANEIELEKVCPHSDTGLDVLEELQSYSVHGVYHLEFLELAQCLGSEFISAVVKTNMPESESRGPVCISQLSPELLDSLRDLSIENRNELTLQWSSMGHTASLGFDLAVFKEIVVNLIELATFAHSHQRHVYLCEVT